MSCPLTVPFHRPSIGQEEIDEVVDTLRSGWLTTGPRTVQFSREFREYLGVPHALAVNSCTAGLHLALAALGIGPGDEVITTPLTFCATVNVILHVGATPVLADVGEDGNIDPCSIEERITSRTRAIIPVHLAGLPVDLDAIWEIARRHRLYVIEDCAHAIGATYHSWPIGAGDPESGNHSDAAAFSFYATKNITTGEGGMVSCHDPELAETMTRLCLHGITRDAWKRYSDAGNWFYEVLEPGFKYNLSDIQAAIGIHQLRKIEGFTALRTRYAMLYNDILAGTEELMLPSSKEGSRHAWHLYILRLKPDCLSVDRAEFIAKLRAEGIGCSVHFIPIQLHPFFAGLALRPENQCPRSVALYEQSISLPLYPAMSVDQVVFVAETVQRLARASRNTRTFAAGWGVQ